MDLIDVSYIIIYLLFPIGIYLIMRKAGIDLFLATVPSFTVLSMLVFAYIGTISLYFGWDEYRFLTGVQDKVLMLKVTCFTMISILGLIAGFLFSKFVLRLNASEVGVPVRGLRVPEAILLVFMFLLCVVVLADYVSKVPRVALLVAIFNPGDDLSAARSLMGNDFAGKYHRYSFFMHDLLSLVTLAFFGNWLVNRSKLAFLIFLITFITASFSATMAIEKGPFAWLLISHFLLYIIVCRRGLIPLRGLMLLASVLVAVLVVFYINFMGSKDVLSAMTSIFSRVFTGQIQPAYHYLEFFPEHHEFLHGRSFPNPGGILPYEPYKLSVEVMNWRNPGLTGAGVVGSMPTVFWGEMYANFGIAGILFPPFFVGIGVYVLSFVVSRLEATPLQAALVVWLMRHYKNLSSTGLSSFVVDIYLVALILIVLGFIVLANHGIIKLRRA